MPTNLSAFGAPTSAWPGTTRPSASVATQVSAMVSAPAYGGAGVSAPRAVAPDGAAAASARIAVARREAIAFVVRCGLRIGAMMRNRLRLGHTPAPAVDSARR